jgi:competence protein ComEC
MQTLHNSTGIKRRILCLVSAIILGIVMAACKGLSIEPSSINAIPEILTVHKMLQAQVTATNISSSDLQTNNNEANFASTSTGSEILRIHFIDVGQGDSILIQFIKKDITHNMLIDGGENNGLALSYLQKLGVNNLDLIVNTHPHSDHLGGLIPIIKSIPVSKIITNGEKYTTPTFEQFLDAALASKADYQEVKRGEKISLDNLIFEVLNPGKLTDDANNNSIVLHGSFGKTTFLFTGDAGIEPEEEILSAGYNVQSDLLKVAHHGSKSASSNEFLNKVSPKVVFIEVGKDNEYGLPSSVTLMKLSNLGTNIFRTDLNGTIVVDITAEGYKINNQVLNNDKRSSTLNLPTTPEPTVSNKEELLLDIVSVSSPVKKGSQASLAIKTSPNASCKIEVFYKNGPSKAKGLADKTAGSDGGVIWNWTVGKSTSSGKWKITVTSSLNGKTISKETYFEVN